MKLTLISYLSVLDEDFEEVALRAVPTPGHQFRRVQTRAGFLQSVAEAAYRRHCLTRLDIHGHGTAGGMNIGEDLLLRAPRDEHWGIFTRVLPYLAPGAQVRLLGCHVGAGPEGHQLLEQLQALLAPGAIRVFAATVRVSFADFGSDGFLPEREWMLAPAGETPAQPSP